VALKVQDVIIDLSTFYPSNAKLSELDSYIQKARDLAGNGNEVVLTGTGPVWLYLKIAHVLHGKARKLVYRSPVTGDVVIFDHSPD
jgi:CRISPR-associated Csx3 family protein